MSDIVFSLSLTSFTHTLYVGVVLGKSGCNSVRSFITFNEQNCSGIPPYSAMHQHFAFEGCTFITIDPSYENHKHQCGEFTPPSDLTQWWN